MRAFTSPLWVRGAALATGLAAATALQSQDQASTTWPPAPPIVKELRGISDHEERLARCDTALASTRSKTPERERDANDHHCAKSNNMRTQKITETECSRVRAVKLFLERIGINP